jgi:hypothetical protein
MVIETIQLRATGQKQKQNKIKGFGFLIIWKSSLHKLKKTKN